jgi:hypothetical protein
MTPAGSGNAGHQIRPGVTTTRSIANVVRIPAQGTFGIALTHTPASATNEAS